MRSAERLQKLLDILGISWKIPKKGWYDCYHSDEMQAFEKFAGNLTSLPFVQDNLMVKVLK